MMNSDQTAISKVNQQISDLLKADKALDEGNVKQAEQKYRKLIFEKTLLPRVYTQLGLICAKSNRIDEAKHLWTSALEHSPNNIEALMGLGDLCKYERKFLEAVEYYKQVLFVDAKFPVVHLNLSYSYLQLGKLDESEKSCLTAIKLAPNFTQAQEYLGEIYVTQGEINKAKQVYEKQLKTTPNNIHILYKLGNIFKAQGKFDEAKSFYHRVIIIDPTYSQAHFTYASITKYIDNQDPHLLEMLKQYQKVNILPENKLQLSFALAKAFEDLRDFVQAFKYFDEGNRLRYEKHHYNIESDAIFIKNIMNTFNKNSIENLNIESLKSNKPIFIVGMPRSGTTLVEKILSTHTEVYGAGELDYFFRLATENFLTKASGFLFSPLESYPKSQIENIGRVYLKQIELLNKDACHITDKLPFNMLLVGFIKIVFPNAKIIHCIRDPKDNCLSIFKKNFTTDNYRFAYNLKTIGQFHNLYRKLMKHWYSVFPGEIYDIHYENLVSEPEKEIQKLVSACNLSWQEECLEFHKSKSVIQTASAVQVRQPMYSKSVGLWKNYEDNLGPLFTELKEYISS